MSGKVETDSACIKPPIVTEITATTTYTIASSTNAVARTTSSTNANTTDSALKKAPSITEIEISAGAATSTASSVGTTTGTTTTVASSTSTAATVAIQINSEPLNANNANNQISEAVNVISQQVRKQKFIENPDQIHDLFEYPRYGSDPGLIVLFNQEIFVTNNPQRKGTTKDVEDLIVTFGRLGFNIHQEYIFHDLTRQEILSEIDKICKLDHSSRNCLIVVFLTHGGREDMLSAKDADLQTKDIWEKFGKCESLRNKPKLFIFQACKGDKLGKAFDDERQQAHVEEDKMTIVPKDIFTVSLTPHILLVYASIEGNVSFRNLEQGTWFIQELCRNFLAYGRRDDVISLIIRTSKCVATYDYEEENNKYKQMPTFVSTLTKKFYLVKSKDRNITLAIKKRQDEIMDVLENLKSRVNILYETNNKGKSK